MVVVAIVGVLAVLASYGIRKYVFEAKTAESIATLGQIAKHAVAAYGHERSDVAAIAAGSTSASTHVLCETSTHVPDVASFVSGKKYQSSPADWRSGSQTVGWACLGFSMEQPQYFQYRYVRPTGTTFYAQSNGDLDGDGNVSYSFLRGAVTNGQARIAPTLERLDAFGD
jgi:type IV pilus assembly protein PilA